MHSVRASGSYYLSANIKCGPGMSAISIDPAADSVVIDFNGFLVEGAAGQTSVNGIDCPAAVLPRSILKVIGFRARSFGGDGVSVESVDDFDMTDAVAQTALDGAFAEVARLEGELSTWREGTAAWLDVSASAGRVRNALGRGR